MSPTLKAIIFLWRALSATPFRTPPSTRFTSFATPQDSDLSVTSQLEESAQTRSTPKDKLNCFLAARDVSPVRTSMMTSWDEAAARTKRHYIRKAEQVVFTALDEIAPNNSKMLFRALKEKHLNEDEGVDHVLLEALAACYENASPSSAGRQILSIFADKVSFKIIQQWLPDVTRYPYNIARHHLLLHGRGVDVPLQKNTRIRVPLDKLDHFLTFITSSRIVQDLPFGEKTLKLSTSEIKIRNVIRNAMPDHIIKQYQSYCVETRFSSPLSRSSLFRILDVCSASTRTSLQGLDYFTAEGGKAFDDMAAVVEKLRDVYGLGLRWSKEHIKNLKEAKRYLKGDYKVSGLFNEIVPSKQ